MSVVFTRIGTPLPGKAAEAYEFAQRRAEAVNQAYGTQAEIHLRIGGPTGQVVLVAKHASIQDLEDIMRRVVEDTAGGKLPVAPEGVFSSIEDAIWLVK